MARPGPISGFPEWLPDQQMVEQRVVDTLRATFELHGFVPVQTRAVEPLEQLLSKGETDKEIYVLRRLHAGDDEGDAGLGLHFDLTVPLARYVVENAGKLTFPLRGYQIQKAWRGERPQEGRYREFLQADFDIIGEGWLGTHHDAELVQVLAEVWRASPFPPMRLSVNNRKIAQGFYRSIGIADIPAALRAVDKLDKIGEQGVREQLVAVAGCTDKQAELCLELARVSAEDDSFVERVQALGVDDPLIDEGLGELVEVLDAARDVLPGFAAADMRIARGFDYYTGTVYEGTLVGHESVGAVCSGGRYDNLASAGEGMVFPGVGLSVGVTRTLSRLFGQGLLRASRTTPTAVLVALPSEGDRPRCRQIAAALRSRGIPTEVAPEPVKYGKQIRYAERRGIPYVWFPEGPSGTDEIRDIRTGSQQPADPAAWLPPESDRNVAIVATEG
ncbi:MAG TPA: histidine--tRNA ligase [Actinomycetota bacterium]|jgi:histidyl-tRNA synthetase